MSQSYQDFEILVVDDGSVDGTGAIVREQHPSVRYIPKENGGASSARNLGAKLASGEFMAFLDADDEWHPEKLQAQVTLMRMYPLSQLSRTAISERPLARDVGLFNGRSDGLPDHVLIKEFAESFLEPYFATSSVMVRRDAFVEIGGFDPGLKIAEDVDLYLRMLAISPLVPLVKGIALHKRTVIGSLGDDSEAGYVQLIDVYKRFLASHPKVAEALGSRIVDEVFAGLWARYAGSQFRNGKRLKAIKGAVRSLRIQPSVLGLRVLLRAVRP